MVVREWRWNFPIKKFLMWTSNTEGQKTKKQRRASRDKGRDPEGSAYTWLLRPGMRAWELPGGEAW